jgi:hypothetical protein
MSCDKLVFDLSQEVEGSPSVFVKKDWVSIIDNQNQNYSSNQSVLDTSQLSNSNKYMSYREAYLNIPLLLTLTSANATASIAAIDLAPVTAATSADYAVGLKNWFGSMIHSFSLDYNGTTIVQQTPFINMWNSFKLMTTLSWGDVATIGSTIGFYPDDPTTWQYQSATSLAGIGVCNNTNISAAGFPVVQGALANGSSGQGNKGFQTRQKWISYDADGVIGITTATDKLSAFIPNSVATTIWKTYIIKKQNAVATTSQGVIQWAINAVVYLKHIHSFFQQVPLLKGVFMKMTMALNNTSVTYQKAITTGLLTLTSVSNAVGGICPIMIASTADNNGGENALGSSAAPASAVTGIVSVAVGKNVLDVTQSSSATVFPVTSGTIGQSVTLYVPAYTFNPTFESAYLSSPVKSIKYTDVYQYQVLAITKNTQFNQLITNGIAGIKSVLVLPFISSGETGVAVPAYSSPFDPAGAGPTSPMGVITNFNVVVSGQNMLYNTQRYPFEEFTQQLLGVNAVNGGLTDGLTSSLLDQTAFENEYCYYYVDVSRMLPVEETVPKSVQLVGTNSTQFKMDYMVFVEYGCSVDIDILTGARV